MNPKALIYWLVVALPLSWGLYKAIEKSVPLFSDQAATAPAAVARPSVPVSTPVVATTPAPVVAAPVAATPAATVEPVATPKPTATP